MAIFGSTPGEQKPALSVLKNFFQEARISVEPRREKWKKHYNYWVNRQVSGKRPTYKSNMRVNLLYVITQVKLPVMTANKPVVNFIAYSGSEKDEQMAENMSKLVGQALWHKLQIPRTHVDCLWNSSVYDIGYYKVGWDPRADFGAGDVYFNSIEPFKILKDPALPDIQACRYMIHIEPYPTSYLKLYYPKYKDFIKADPSISQVLFEERRHGDRYPTRAGVTDQTKFAIERAYKIEYHLHPDVSGKDLEKDAPKYPKGRVITTINNSVIVDDKPNPFEHGKKPFVKNIMNVVGGEFYGMGDLEQCVPLQDGLNHAYQQVDDIATQCANIGWRLHPGVGKTGIQRVVRDLPKPGAIKIVPPELLQPDDAPQLPAYLVRRIEDIVNRFMDVSGISEILMGSGRVTHRTARGIERLFEAGTSRIGQSIQFSEESLGESATMLAQVVAQFYKNPRYMPIFDSEGTVSEMMQLDGKEFTQGKFQASIDSGAALPRDKQSRADLVFNLQKMGVFEMAMAPDPAAKEIAKVILNAVEFPGREQLLRNLIQVPPPQPEPGPPLEAPVPPAGLPLSGPAGLGVPPVPAPPGQFPPEVLEMAAAAGVAPEELVAMLTQAAGPPGIGT